MTHQKTRRLMEALAFERDCTVLTEDIVLRDQAQECSFYGRDAVMAFLDSLFTYGFTGTWTEVQTVVTEEKCAALAFVFRGRHDGPFLGIPPTGQEVVVPMVLICRIQEDGIKQAALYYNAGTLLHQLGLA